VLNDGRQLVEAWDRGGGSTRCLNNRTVRVPRMLAPFGIRDFALLRAGMTVSLIGDGVLLVALTWQTYELSRSKAPKDEPPGQAIRRHDRQGRGGHGSPRSRSTMQDSAQ
jgi:hypothetical protein